jgi:hypothetical protein
MLRFPSTAFLAFPLGFTLSLFLSQLPAHAQASDPRPVQNSAAAGSAQSSSKQTASEQTAARASSIPADAPYMSQQTRYNIIRDFETQLVYARTAFPMGKKGLQLKEGVITPNGEELRQELSLWGPAIKPGDPAHISSVQIKPDHIHFEINGGPVLRKKWYQHIEVGATNGPVTPGAANNPASNPHGSFVNLYFDKHVPEMTAQQLRVLLLPVLDFNAQNKEQAYLSTVPPGVREAIEAHRVLVGMNQEMVIHAKGKPPRKVRERDGETEYEEWIYGEPPADTDFVRIVGDEVVRVETMKVSGEKIVRTAKEVVLSQAEKDKTKEAKKEPAERPANAPSLRRPGEDSQGAPQPASGAPPVSPPDVLQPPSGPGEWRASR